MKAVADELPGAMEADAWSSSPTPGSLGSAAESDLDRLCRERRRALDEMHKLIDDLRREQVQRRFHRIRHGYG